MTIRLRSTVLGAAALAAILVTALASPVRAGLVDVDECKKVDIARGVAADLAISTNTTGAQTASGAIDGMATLEVCVALSADAGASADPALPTVTITPEPPAADSTKVCVNVGVAISGGASASGKVSATISATATGSALGLPIGGTTPPIGNDVPVQVGPETAGENVSVTACVSTTGKATVA